MQSADPGIRCAGLLSQTGFVGGVHWGQLAALIAAVVQVWCRCVCSDGGMVMGLFNAVILVLFYGLLFAFTKCSHAFIHIA